MGASSTGASGFVCGGIASGGGGGNINNGIGGGINNNSVVSMGMGVRVTQSVIILGGTRS
jgi:hypothetical protein